MLWEYRILSIHDSTVNDLLKECDATDWELVSVVAAQSGPPGVYRCFLKRPISGATGDLLFHYKGRDYYVTVNNSG